MSHHDFTEIWAKRDAFDSNPSYLLPIFADIIGRQQPISYVDRNALDIGMGMGADAAYLARRGYSVDGLDTCPTATQKVIEAATKLNLPITTYTSDLNEFESLDKKYDVGLAIKLLHFQTPTQQSTTFTKLEELIKPKGYVIIRALTTDTQNATTQHPGLLTPGEIYRRFASWNIKYHRCGVRVNCKNKRNEDSVQVFDDLIAQKLQS